MAKKMIMGGEDIPVATYRGEYFFLTTAVAKSLGYKSSLPLPKEARVIRIGQDNYLSSTDLRQVCGTATGERRNQAAALLQRIAETYGIQVSENGMVLPLTESTRQWIQARESLRISAQKVRKYREDEERLWRAIEEERKND